MWTVEAFRASDGEFEWDIDLDGADHDTLQRALDVSEPLFPGMVPIEVDQVRILLSTFSSAHPRGYIREGLKYFLTEFSDG